MFINYIFVVHIDDDDDDVRRTGTLITRQTVVCAVRDNAIAHVNINAMYVCVRVGGNICGDSARRHSN